MALNTLLQETTLKRGVATKQYTQSRVQRKVIKKFVLISYALTK